MLIFCFNRFWRRVVESRKGFKLLPVADFFLGSAALVMLPHRVLACAGSQVTGALYSRESVGQISSVHQRFEKSLATKYCTAIGTVSGEFGFLIPLDDRVYRRLILLQQIMGNVARTACALNPREFRMLRVADNTVERRGGILDGTLLWMYFELPIETQDELSSAMGTTSDVLIESLLEIDNAWNFF